ncbi:hypothetical protein LQ318_11370 [Aliifodinibius salicampi]|uniref:Uncharacterized protein n=1 Tax=Fodinibius salicampi TaxID=1920655 RepID=A0ABT3Q089_9BACT|nr:hypothetical protein [Fodinibius salicampi]MCW9713502.1 hypothetical protein [Fodinibius salicampi]
MFKKIVTTVLLIGFFSVPVAAQSTYIEVSYQSFKPFINFQLNLSTQHSYYQRSHQSAYLKGYMDGVNDAYYLDYRFYDMVYDIDMYEAGYRDGYRDRTLLIRLRGHRYMRNHHFSYNDYHSPYYSVQIWLDGLTFAFIQAPRHRLPDRWTYHVHPRVKKYRNRMKVKRYHARIERRYHKRINHLRKDAHRMHKRYTQKKGRNSYRSGEIQHVSKIDKNRAMQKVRRTDQKGSRYGNMNTVQSRSQNRNIKNNSHSKRKASPAPQIRTRSRNAQHQPQRSNRASKKQAIKRGNNKRPQKSVRSRSNNRGSQKKAVSKGKKRSRGGDGGNRRGNRSRGNGRGGN